MVRCRYWKTRGLRYDRYKYVRCEIEKKEMEIEMGMRVDLYSIVMFCS